MTKATIRGKHYKIPSLNIGQLERMGPLLTGGGNTFALFRLCVERAEPAITDDDCPKMPELRKIIQDVLQDAGFAEAAEGADPQQAAAE